MKKLDQDILAAAEWIQELRKDGELNRVRRIIIHCSPEKGELKTVEVDRKLLYPIGEAV